MREHAIVQVTDLIGRPGASRRVDLELPTPEGLSEALVEFAEQVRLDGVIESVVDGLLVRATVLAPSTLSCARCLKPTQAQITTEVAELYAEPGARSAERRYGRPQEGLASGAAEENEPDPGYEVLDGRIDLEPLLRDALAPAMPYRPLCTPDCRGLCATCGADLNETTCGCADAPADLRWSVLERLELPDTQ